VHSRLILIVKYSINILISDFELNSIATVFLDYLLARTFCRIQHKAQARHVEYRRS
jgi:hypothetical protein